MGPGGVGKTRLALEIGRCVAEQGSTRAVFVELAGVRDPSFLALGIAEALGLSDVTANDLPRSVRLACSDEHPTFLSTRQLRADSECGTARRRSGDGGRVAPNTGDEPCTLRVRGGGCMPSDLWRVRRRAARRRPRISSAFPRSGFLSIACATCNRGFGSRRSTHLPSPRSAGVSMRCRSRSSWRLPG